jgi:hypothetical protein
MFADHCRAKTAVPSSIILPLRPWYSSFELWDKSFVGADYSSFFRRKCIGSKSRPEPETASSDGMRGARMQRHGGLRFWQARYERFLRSGKQKGSHSRVRRIRSECTNLDSMHRYTTGGFSPGMLRILDCELRWITEAWMRHATTKIASCAESTGTDKDR